MSEWVSIKNPPDGGARVLVWFPEAKVCDLIWWNDKLDHVDSYEDNAFGSFRLGKPSHWMPMPQPPERPKRGRPASSSSTESLKPWVAAGVSRSAWYLHQRIERLAEKALLQALAESGKPQP